MNTDLQNDLIEVFDKIREQKIGNKIGEYDCANDEALKWIEETYGNSSKEAVIFLAGYLQGRPYPKVFDESIDSTVRGALLNYERQSQSDYIRSLEIKVRELEKRIKVTN